MSTEKFEALSVLSVLKALCEVAGGGDELISEEYRDFVRSKIVKTSDEQRYLFLGCLSEVGEVADVLAKGMRVGRKLDFDKFLDECGDVLFYLTQLNNKTFICYALEKIAAPLMFEPKEEHQQFIISGLEKVNMDKLNQRLKDTGSHVK